MPNISDILITLIVPVYQSEGTLRRAIDSAIGQTHTNLEIILINDGSTDSSGQICDEYARLDSRIKVIHQENKGVGAARNAGIDVASGEYIAFLDSDDYMEKDMLETLLRACLENGCDMSFFGKYKIDKDNAKLMDRRFESDMVLETEELLKYVFLNMIPIAPWHRLSAKHLFAGVRFCQGISSGEDCEFLPRLIKNANRCAYVNRYLYHYVFNPRSLCHSPDRKEMNTMYTAYAFLKRFEFQERNASICGDRAEQIYFSCSQLCQYLQAKPI